MIWDQEKIKAVLPHRYPFLFLDEVIEIEGTQRIVAVKYIGEDEDYFKGHFPGNPIMPGVLITEAMAQSSIILYSVAKPDIAARHPDYYLGKIKSEFFSPVYPGDKLFIETTKVKFSDYAGIADAVTMVNNKIVAKANIVFSVKDNE
ncbi:MAG: 3-hydroxyacyl-ACP dehydratase FabZ [Nitrospirae bacterium]|nr:3-hydroxyacyl-ACP dehydratase FabZ [Nitrospirota bacterium]